MTSGLAPGEFAAEGDSVGETRRKRRGKRGGMGGQGGAHEKEAAP